MITARDKDRSVELLRLEGFEPEVLSIHKPGLAHLGGELLLRTARFMRVAAPFEPDVLVGVMGPTVALAGRLRGCTSVVIYDTEIARRTNSWVFPMASLVVTPRAYEQKSRPHHVRYPGYQSLAYLHPDRFMPDPARVRAAGLDPTQPYAVFRFVAFESSHDSREAGIDIGGRIELVREVSRSIPVVVSSERPLPEEIAKYGYSGLATDFHHVLAYAALSIGDSATVASESAVLGTHAIYIATSDRGYLREQSERYGLVDLFHAEQFEQCRSRVLECVGNLEEVARESADGRTRLLQENGDFAAYLVELLERVGTGAGAGDTNDARRSAAS